MQTDYVFRAFLIGALCSVPTVSSAATLYMDPPSSEIFPGDTISLSVRVDTDEGECINAVDATIQYPNNLQLVDVSRGSSIFPIWVEDPIINTNDRVVTFAGGIPNGYCGRVQGDPRLTNTILELIFQAPGMVIGGGDQDPNAVVRFSDSTTVYLNDGRGTAIAPRLLDAQVAVNRQSGGDINNEWNPRVSADTVPPEEFAIELAQAEGIHSNKYYIVFNTTDKQSGLAYYEVIEEPIEDFALFKWGGVNAPWVTARSPYILKDQSLNSIIRVRAVDKAGNEYVASYIPEESLRKLSQQRVIDYTLIGAGLLIVLIIILLLLRHRLVRRRTADGNGDTDHDAAILDEDEVLTDESHA